MWTKWGNPAPHDITTNEERMKAPWDPNERDIADVIKQINDGNLFAYFVGHKKPDNNLVTIGEKIILDTGLFAIQYGQWRKIDPGERTWAKFDEFWTAELTCGMKPHARRHSMGMAAMQREVKDPKWMKLSRHIMIASNALEKRTGITPQHSPPLRKQTRTWQTALLPTSRHSNNRCSNSSLRCKQRHQ